MSSLTLDLIKKSGAFVSAPVKIEGKIPDSEDSFVVFVKQQSLGDSLRILAAQKEDDMSGHYLMTAAIADCLLDENGNTILTQDHILSLGKDSKWYEELLRIYLEVNGTKKKN